MFRETQLNPSTLSEIIGQGGWIVTDGRCVENIMFPHLPVTQHRISGGKLLVETTDRGFELPVDNVTLTNPWTIEVSAFHMVRVEKKKIHGGGWQEVPKLHVALRLENPAIKEAEGRRRKEEAAERQMQRQEALAAERHKLAERLMSEFGNKKLVGLKIEPFGATLKFEDGGELLFELDGGDLFDAFLCVQGETILHENY
jgi:hypothetical protein